MTISRSNARARQRWSLLGTGVAALMLLATAVLALVVDGTTADQCDIQVPSSASSDICTTDAGAIVEYIGSDADNQSSGTGIFDPFVRLQGSPAEKGYNTNGTIQFETKSGKWTHAILVSAIPVVNIGGTNYWELFVDINEGNSAKQISLNEMEIWFTTNPLLTGYVDDGTGFPSGASLQYDFTGEILINDVNQGSGRGDLRYLVPLTGIPTPPAGTFFVLYSEWGGTSAGASFVSEGGFEEWKVRKAPSVSIVKTADAASVNPGQNIGFTITVTNNGAADATGVTISDPLPGGSGIDWAESPDNANCSISGSPPNETLNCGPVTLAAGGGSLSVHVQSATTGASCGTYNNTANFTSTNAGSGSASASTSVDCAAIQVLKQSTKTGNPLVTDPTPLDNTDNAVFTVTPPVGSAFDVTDNGTGDEDSTYGEVCVSGLAPGTYTVTEKTAPEGYASGNPGFDTTAVAATGTNCNGSHPTTANSAIFRNPPLGEFIINFNDLGSGETSAKIDCTGLTPTPDDATPTAHDDDTETYTNLPGADPAIVYTCTISIDP